MSKEGPTACFSNWWSNDRRTGQGLSLRCWATSGWWAKVAPSRRRGRAAAPARFALWDQPAVAGFIAGTLWLDASDQQVGAGLRSAMWRLRKFRTNLVHVRPGGRLSLGPTLSVDGHRLLATAEQLRSAAPVSEVAEQLFEADLFPG